jgi:hypothetical protein
VAALCQRLESQQARWDVSLRLSELSDSLIEDQIRPISDAIDAGDYAKAKDMVSHLPPTHPEVVRLQVMVGTLLRWEDEELR